MCEMNDRKQRRSYLPVAAKKSSRVSGNCGVAGTHDTRFSCADIQHACVCSDGCQTLDRNWAYVEIISAGRHDGRSLNSQNRNLAGKLRGI